MEDKVVGSLRDSVGTLQELLRYLEAQPGFSRADAAYCQEKVKEAVRQLKAFRSVVDEQRSAGHHGLSLSWN